MANFMDYLDWRGDLTFEQSPFCEIDDLILSCLSYVNLDGIAPMQGESPKNIQEISEVFFKRYSPEKLADDHSFIHMMPFLMQKMADSRRFSQTMIQNYINRIDTEQVLQFSAMELLIEDGTSFVSYRGTDDTIVGWKEDFLLSTGVVASEKEAVDYLNCVGTASMRKMRVGGHSKGGNLAIYAAAECLGDVQDILISVSNHDGPGFKKEFLASDGLVRILPKIQRFIPESSVIGMLLEHAKEPTIIKSSEKAIMQHDAFSWQLMGNQFERCSELSKTGKMFDTAVRSWLANIPEDKRPRFITDFFSVLEAPGTGTVSSLQKGGIKTAAIMLAQVEKLSPETRKDVENLIRAFMSSWMEYAK